MPNTETEKAISQMEVQATNFASRFIKDANVRRLYMEKTKTMSTELRLSYQQGHLTAKQAATAANEMRNQIMEFARQSSSDLGRAKAIALKTKGLDIADLIEKYSQSLFKTPFNKLDINQKNSVYLKIVDKAGEANPKVSARVSKLGKAGRGLWILSACLAIYNISSAENKVDRAGREAANIGGGFAGGAAGGAVAGIWFGPIGVAIGAVIGGVLGAIASDQVYVEVSGPDGDFPGKFIPRFTNAVSVDEQGMADALIKECGTNLDLVYNIFKQLDDKYTTDVDDVALLYLRKLRSMPSSPVLLALKKHSKLRELLVLVIDEGWTSDEEKKLIYYLKMT